MVRIPGLFGSLRARSLGIALLCSLLVAGCGGGGDDDGGGGGGGGPPAPTLTLTANPTAVTAGGTITLSWSATNATSCTASGGWGGSKPTSGTQDIAAAAGTTTFTLSCTGTGGSISRSTTVTASAAANPPPAVSLSSSTSTATVGSSFTLTWSSTNASACTASGGWTGPKATSGSESIVAASAGAIVYTLTCSGPGGNATQSTTVTINPASQPTLSLVANPANVAVGATFVLQWASANVSSCTASGAWSGSRATSGTATFTAVAPGTATFTLACTGTSGGVSQTATVIITPAEIGQPYVLVTVMGFNRTVQLPEVLSAGKTALVYVDVWNQAGTAPVTNATVSVNGTTLPYYGSMQAYAAEMILGPGAMITASVTVNGTAYVASTRQFDTYPVISTPLEGMSWINNVPNEIRWSGTSSRPGAQLILRMLGPTAAQDWPAKSWVNPVPGATTHVVPASTLSALDYVLMVGYADITEFAGAMPGSAFILGGFDYRRVSVRNPPPTPPGVTQLNFKTPPPVAVGVGGTKQMSVEAVVNCCSHEDWTAKANWSTSDPDILTVSATGVVTGVAAGTANVIASFNGVSASMPVRVYQAPPLPAGPPTASTAFQGDHTHAGFLTLGSAPVFPLANRWSATFSGKVSYPVVADGRVFVVVDKGVGPGGVLGSSVLALDVNTGATLWGPVEHSSAYRWAAHAYANGRLFVITASGLLRALDAATGAEIWSVQMPGNMAYSAPPVAVNGLVYLSFGQGLMFAVSQEDGTTLWSSSVANGMDSSPTVGSGGVYVSYACDAYRLDPFSGDTLWHHHGSCSSGGGGRTSVLSGDKLFAEVSTSSGPAFRTFNPSDGAILDGFAPAARPAVAAGKAYFVSSGVLHAVDIATNTTLWTHTADPTLNTAPLVIDNMVAVGSSAGTVYLFDAPTGNVLWSGQAAAGVSTTYEGQASMPSGLGAGGGFLLVPGENTLTGWKMVP